MDAKTVISTGIIKILLDENLRASLSTATSIMPLSRRTINMPPIISVKKTTSPASTKPLGIAVKNSTAPVGVDSTYVKDSGSTAERPFSNSTRSNSPAGIKYVAAAATIPNTNKMTYIYGILKTLLFFFSLIIYINSFFIFHCNLNEHTLKLCIWIKKDGFLTHLHHN